MKRAYDEQLRCQASRLTFVFFSNSIFIMQCAIRKQGDIYEFHDRLCRWVWVWDFGYTVKYSMAAVKQGTAIGKGYTREIALRRNDEQPERVVYEGLVWFESPDQPVGLSAPQPSRHLHMAARLQYFIDHRDAYCTYYASKIGSRSKYLVGTPR